ncbi:hypothetical protein AAE478_009255, partial [Parahypoxylon ruwenzoriense]
MWKIQAEPGVISNASNRSTSLKPHPDHIQYFRETKHWHRVKRMRPVDLGVLDSFISISRLRIRLHRGTTLDFDAENMQPQFYRSGKRSSTILGPLLFRQFFYDDRTTFVYSGIILVSFLLDAERRSWAGDGWLQNQMTGLVPRVIENLT